MFKCAFVGKAGQDRRFAGTTGDRAEWPSHTFCGDCIIIINIHCIVGAQCCGGSPFWSQLAVHMAMRQELPDLEGATGAKQRTTRQVTLVFFPTFSCSSSPSSLCLLLLFFLSSRRHDARPETAATPRPRQSCLPACSPSSASVGAAHGRRAAHPHPRAAVALQASCGSSIAKSPSVLGPATSDEAFLDPKAETAASGPCANYHTTR